MKNLLYIYPEFSKERAGGDVINERNLSLLELIESLRVFKYELQSKGKLNTLKNLCLGYCGSLDSRDICQIYEIIKKNNISHVFLWSSRIGYLAYLLKREFQDIKIITFYHNIELVYYLEEYKVTKSLKTELIKLVTQKNEKLATVYSDLNITLNSRDADLLYEIYGVRSNLNLPTSFIDTFDERLKHSVRGKYSEKTLRLLFLGSNFFANKDGIHWFLKEVLPNLSGVHLTIAGKGMNQIFQTSSTIDVKGYVPDVSELYYSSDIVISPIFYGSGMKTKTCEALMYGMPIIGTKEAFEGYDLNYDNIGGVFNDALGMVELINKFKSNQNSLKKAQTYARKVFIEKFSTFRLAAKLEYSIDNLVC